MDFVLGAFRAQISVKLNRFQLKDYTSFLQSEKAYERGPPEPESATPHVSQALLDPPGTEESPVDCQHVKAWARAAELRTQSQPTAQRTNGQ